MESIRYKRFVEDEELDISGYSTLESNLPVSFIDFDYWKLMYEKFISPYDKDEYEWLEVYKYKAFNYSVNKLYDYYYDNNNIIPIKKFFKFLKERFVIVDCCIVAFDKERKIYSVIPLFLEDDLQYKHIMFFIFLGDRYNINSPFVAQSLSWYTHYLSAIKDILYDYYGIDVRGLHLGVADTNMSYIVDVPYIQGVIKDKQMLR
jgi:hypothetical protein